MSFIRKKKSNGNKWVKKSRKIEIKNPEQEKW